MKIIRHLDDLPHDARGGAVAIGNFDGVHLGHMRIIERLCAKAEEVDGPAVVLTFDPHPVRLLRPEACPPPLTWTERKAELLVAEGVDWMIAYPTDIQLLQLTARDFFQNIVCDKLAAKALVEGNNFFFGHNREGNVQLLCELADASGIVVEIAKEVAVGGKEETVSSSRVRKLIAKGDVAKARRLLSSPYRLRGIVTHGAGRGAVLGFPTANLVGIDTLVPMPGVYAGRGWAAGESWSAAINIGPNPTFGENSLKVEVHLIGRRDPLYGQIVEVDFWERLRDIQTFDSAEALIEQLEQDKTRVQAILPVFC